MIGLLRTLWSRALCEGFVHGFFGQGPPCEELFKLFVEVGETSFKGLVGRAPYVKDYVFFGGGLGPYVGHFAN